MTEQITPFSSALIEHLSMGWEIVPHHTKIALLKAIFEKDNIKVSDDGEIIIHTNLMYGADNSVVSFAAEPPNDSDDSPDPIESEDEPFPSSGIPISSGDFVSEADDEIPPTLRSSQHPNHIKHSKST